VDLSSRLDIDSRSRIPGIQILRGISVIAVVLFHLFPKAFPNAYLGVDLFFVISGFVVTPLIMQIFSKNENVPGKLFQFYRRRFFRLFPAAGVTVVSTLILISLFGTIYDHARSARQAIASLLLMGNFGAYRFSAGDYFDPNPNPLVHMWSLSAEEQIYIMVPLLIALCGYALQRRIQMMHVLTFLVISGILTQIFLFPHIFAWLGFRNVEGILFYSPFSYIWKFALGGIAFLIHLQRKDGGKQKPTVLVTTSLLIAIICVILSSLSWSNLDYIAVLLIAFMLSRKSIPIKINRFTLIFQRIGDISYSIYLVHMPIIYIGLRSPYTHEISYFWKVTLTTFLIAASSHFLYKYIENKFREHSQSSSKNHLRSLLKSIGLFSAVPVVISTILLSLYTQTPGTFKTDELPIYAGNLDAQCDRLTSGNACWYPIQDAKGVALLIGDSVAIAYSEEFIKQSHEQNMTAVTMGLAGCSYIRKSSVDNLQFPKLFDVYSSKVANNRVTCFEHNDNVVEFVNKYSPKVVFLSQHSVDQENEEYLEISKRKLRNLRIQNQRDFPSIERNLVVVGASPLLPYTRLVAMPTLWSVVGSREPVEIADLNDDYLKEDRYLLTELVKQGIEYRSLLSLFCGNTSCPVFRDKKWIFRDSSHVSVYGSTYLLNIFKTS